MTVERVIEKNEKMRGKRVERKFGAKNRKIKRKKESMTWMKIQTLQ